MKKTYFHSSWAAPAFDSRSYHHQTDQTSEKERERKADGQEGGRKLKILNGNWFNVIRFHDSVIFLRLDLSQNVLKRSLLAVAEQSGEENIKTESCTAQKSKQAEWERRDESQVLCNLIRMTMVISMSGWKSQNVECRLWPKRASAMWRSHVLSFPPSMFMLWIFSGEKILLSANASHIIVWRGRLPLLLFQWRNGIFLSSRTHQSSAFSMEKSFLFFLPLKFQCVLLRGERKSILFFFLFISLKLKLKFSRKNKTKSNVEPSVWFKCFCRDDCSFSFSLVVYFILFISSTFQFTPAALELKIHESWLIPPCEWLNLFSFSSLISISEKDIISLGLRRTHDDSEERTGKQLSTEEEALIENIELKQTSGIIFLFRPNPKLIVYAEGEFKFHNIERNTTYTRAARRRWKECERWWVERRASYGTGDMDAWRNPAFRWCKAISHSQSTTTTFLLNAYNKLFILLLILLNTSGNSIQPGELDCKNVFFTYFFFGRLEKAKSKSKAGETWISLSVPVRRVRYMHMRERAYLWDDAWRACVLLADCWQITHSCSTHKSAGRRHVGEEEWQKVDWNLPRGKSFGGWTFLFFISTQTLASASSSPYTMPFLRVSTNQVK